VEFVLLNSSNNSGVEGGTEAPICLSLPTHLENAVGHIMGETGLSRDEVIAMAISTGMEVLNSIS
jgi:hypothetical protein